MNSEEIELIRVGEIIDEVSKKYDKIWKKRNREIDSKFLVSFIFQKITNKNKGYGISLMELWDTYKNNNIEIGRKKIYASSSVCEARQKLHEDIFKEINEEIILKYGKCKKEELLLNRHRVFAIDGTRVNLPREMVDCEYKTCNKETYYPQGLMSCMYNINTQVVHDYCLEKYMNERVCAAKHIKSLEEGDVVIFDRGYFSYLMLYQCEESGINPIFRISVNLANKEIQDFMSSDAMDTVVEYKPASTVKNQLKRQGYDLDFKSIKLRLMKHEIEGQLYLYGTTLIGEEYKAELFGELYHSRWKIEEFYKISKCLVNLEEFSSKSERGLKQEIYAHFALINLARLFCNISRIQNGDGKNDVQYNFKNCLNLIGRNIQNLIYKTVEIIENIVSDIIVKISKIKQRIRPNRKYKRISHKPFNRWIFNRRHCKV